MVITISRQYGSGGQRVGQMVAKKLGIPYYDKEVIELAAEQSGFEKRCLKKQTKMHQTAFYSACRFLAETWVQA